ncbi:MAG: polysaccharide biosynthesis protein [Candidatus Omnitrophica bacterium]|nr:polysaccharide biosynthesis protein [Candidatus Omnitrophota bacterium]
MIFKGKTILVIGGTGSLGKVFVKRVLSGKLGTPKKIIVMSRDEAKQHDMRMSYLHKLVATDEVIYNNFKNALEFRIGDVRNYADVCSAVKNVDIVVQAAALKQVPTCEYFPTQAVLTNCMGASNIVRAIEENSYSVDTVIGVSTDKACKPVNVMGMTKAIQERIFIAANILNPETRFICVRYGNVLASRGSVIPLFHEQIKNGGPVTVTVPEMTRFLLSLNQAVETLFAALRFAKRGETYVPKVPAATVINVAKALIGKRKIEIKITGIRPAEKMHEIMVSEEEATRCVRRGNYYAILPMLPELRKLSKQEPPALKKEFSSEDTALDFSQTVALLKKHKIMIEDIDLSQGEELLR